MLTRTVWIASWGLISALLGCRSSEPAQSAPAPLVTSASPSGAAAPSAALDNSDASAAPPASSAPGHADAGGHAFALSARDEAIVRAVYPEILACYKSGLAGDENLEGVVSFRLDLDDGGKVAAAAPISSSFPAAVSGCMTKKLEALRFERAKDGRREPLFVSFRCIRPNAYDGPARVEDGSKPRDVGY